MENIRIVKSRCASPIKLHRDPPVVSHSTGELLIDHEVPCGKCYWCMQSKASAWRTRLVLEELHSETPTLFVTLTYDDRHLPDIYVHAPEYRYLPVLDPPALTKYLKRLRKALGETKIRFFAIGEYGGETCRPHYHIMLFNYPRKNPTDDYDTWSHPITSTWSFGNVDIRTVDAGIVSYLSGYHALRYGSPDGWPKPFMRCSKGMGLPTEEEIAFVRATSTDGNANMAAIGSPGGFHSPYVWNKLFPFEELGAYAKTLHDPAFKVPESFDPDTVSRAMLKEKIKRKGKFDGTVKESVHQSAPPRIISKTF